VLSRAIYKKQRGRRLLTALATVSLVTGVFVASGTVFAVHDETFQLDGDAIESTQTNVGLNGPQTVDWDSIFTAAGAPKASLPTGYKDAGFQPDFKTATNGSFVTSDNSTYATGSKDTLPISGWQCNQDNNVNSKIDVMNAYSVAYKNGAGDDLLYFGLERNTNTGTADVGFWFLQGAAGCESTGSAVTFSGEHLDGDVLVVSEFTNGGRVSTINVYRWDRPGNPVGVPGSLRTTPIGSGVDCRDPLLSVGDPACAASNTTAQGTNGTITVPWSTANFKDGVGHSLRTSEFFEGGINLTDLGLGGKCFNTFIGDTRSSTSLTATLFDFAAKTTGQCTSGIVTTPQAGDGTAVPTSIGTSARVAVRDHAVITVGGTQTFGGTVKFFLCGPLASNTTTNCSTGGVQIGTPATGETVTGSAGSATVDSDTATLTSAGRYCWRAEYSGDSATGVPASSDPSKAVADGGTTSECFTLAPVQPVLTTSAGADVTLGTAISDTASLTGTAKQPGTDGVGPGGTINATAATQAAAGGSITFTVKGPDSCSASGLTVTGTPVTVSGDNTSYGPVTATPTATGKYTFVAEYTSPTTNTLAAGPSSCPPSATDGDEEVVVNGTSSVATAQDWLPNDTATLTGSTNLNGTLTFQLYTGDNCGATSGSAVSGQSYSVTVTNAASGSTFSTSNSTSFLEADSDTYSWKVTYDDNNLQDPAAPTCETTVLTIDDTP
jgi:hypothetical protein